ncbi:MAG: DEAD/DEAH box helicase, partial [Candidatus Saccharimonas sp.]
PASLKEQWWNDLASVFGLIDGSDFLLVSQQDLGAMDKMSELDKYKQVDLFIIDEAHNLRNTGSTRYDHILKWFQENEESKILMLTATPINNSLNDLVNQIQLGLKGELDSVLVPYRNPRSGRLDMIDFFDALGRIQKRSNGDPNFDWESVKPTLVSGIQHYLVRSTRQGVEAEGSLIGANGERKAFPKSIVGQIEYSYDNDIASRVSYMIEQKISLLEGIDPRNIDLEKITEETQRASHPLDFAHKVIGSQVSGVIPNVFQLVTLFGFTPYKPETYLHKIYRKSPEEIRNLGIKGRESQIINLQLAIHNMLLVTWLKRLESSSASLLKSIQTYERRLESFRSWLERGYILSFRDISIVEQEYGEDIDRAFDEYESFEVGDNDTQDELKRKGVERKLADDGKYNIDAMFKDIARDLLVARSLIDILEELANVENDSKIREFAKYLERVVADGVNGKKVLVFSFFADTINYLRDNLSSIISIKDFAIRSEFISGQSRSVEDTVRRFSPQSKKYEMKKEDTHLDFLFATDILSEGQNLQDAGILINYDLHWNPVRMIQRNGRINRLGSKYSEVLISNLKPEDNIELYLNLVARLQKKINTIKNTVGLDQGVLSSEDINPLEFVEDIRRLYSGNVHEATRALDDLGGDKDLLSWTNDHVYRLREFMNNSSDEEIRRIRAIPEGKWNYLPANSPQDHGKVMSLLRVDGKTSITHEPITQTFFVETTTSGEYASEIIDEFLALQSIQAGPEDNTRLVDSIHIDREVVKRRSVRTAHRRAETGESNYALKPRQIESLVAIQQMFPDLSLRPFLENNIRDARTKRNFESIARLINNDIKTTGSINVSTINKFTNFLATVKVFERQLTNVDLVSHILNYSRRNG